MTREQLAKVIDDWFLDHKGHYAGQSVFEADIDMTVNFLELAEHIQQAERAMIVSL